MNEDQYRALCSSCDRLLLADDSNIDRVAIPWLHVIRPHPNFLKQYVSIFRSRGSCYFILTLRRLAASVSNLVKSCFHRREFWSTAGVLPTSCDVLIISHFLSNSFLENDDDFYYGPIASSLVSQGISSTIALLNHTAESSDIICAKWRPTKIPRVILTSLLGPITELTLYRRALFAALRLISSLPVLSNEFDIRIALRAAVEAVSPEAISVLRISIQIQELVVRLQPSTLVLTYEGHSWERIAFASARAVIPQIVCIGYQHAAISYLQHAVQRPLAKLFNPDLILTSGYISRFKFLSNSLLFNVKVETLGSVRCVHRQPLRTYLAVNHGQKTCLVLPEGTMSECNVLFDFSLRCASLLPNINFVWRLHPSICFNSLVLKNPQYRDLPCNIIISTSSLLDDISISYWALFRASTSIVQASVSGVRPVYLSFPGEIPINTLFDIHHLHSQVVEPKDFIDLTLEPENNFSLSSFNALQDYCEQMFTQIDPTILSLFITATD